MFEFFFTLSSHSSQSVTYETRGHKRVKKISKCYGFFHMSRQSIILARVA